jgi:hypothetical protein
MHSAAPLLRMFSLIFGGLITGRVVSLALDRGLKGYGGVIRALFFIDAAGFG